MEKMSAMDEGNLICRVLVDRIPANWDGKRSTLELKEADYNWRQMEWIGWYFEFKAKRIVINSLGGEDGPIYGRTRFDYVKSQVWDFKSHVVNSSSHPWAIINDREAIDRCIDNFGGLGVILASGIAEYDGVKGGFKLWHDELKGKLSQYEVKRIKRGARSRTRKTGFNLKKIEVLWMDRVGINEGLKRKWLDLFQEGMRNSNGSMRRPKYEINVEKIPSEAMVTSIDLGSSLDHP